MPNRYFIQMYGCQMNVSDGERIAALLDGLGFQPSEHETEADLIIVVACAIRQRATDRIYGKARTWRSLKTQRPLITALSGCVVGPDRVKLKKVFDIIFDIRDLPSFPGMLKPFLSFTAPTKQTVGDYFKIQPKYGTLDQAYIPIMTGCNNFCTYCVVPYTRGREKSRPIDDITAEVQTCLEQGRRVITLLGQNVNSYGLDHLPARLVSPDGHLRFRGQAKQADFPQLLQQLARLPFAYWLRFLTSNPQDISDRLIDVLANEPNCAKYLHLPIQSGDDEVLRRMNRRYTVAYYRQLISRLRRRLPGLVITTDVIVGFCGETEEQFLNTLRLFEEIGFDMAYTAQYSHRPNTGAWRALKDDVPHLVKVEREKRLTEVLKAGALQRNQALIGTKQVVLVDQWRSSFVQGKTAAGKSVRLPSKQDRRGRFVLAEITKAQAWSLAGRIIADDVTAHGAPKQPKN